MRPIKTFQTRKKIRWHARSNYCVTICIVFSLIIFQQFFIFETHAETKKISIEKSVKQIEFFIFPKLSLKTNKYLISITIDNRSEEVIKAKITPRNLPVAVIYIPKKEALVKPLGVKNINYMLSFSKPYFGPLPSELIEIITTKKSYTENTKNLSVDINLWNMPVFVFFLSFLSQFVVAIPIIGRVGMYVAGKLKMNKKISRRFLYGVSGFVLVLALIYDIIFIFFIPVKYHLG